MLTRTKRWLNGPHVLILKEKHADIYYLFSNAHELGIICVEIVKNRLKAGYYDYDNCEKPIPPEGITKESIINLPPSLQDTAQKALKCYQQALTNWDEDNRLTEIIQKACQGDPKWARILLEERLNCEYEGYEVESLITPENILEKDK